MIRPLSIQDLLFANTALECETNDGFRFHRLVRVGMPRIPPNVLKCVFYLYHTRKDAKASHDPQGTGFLVGVPLSKYSDDVALYAVTAWHMAADESDRDNPAAPVIRLNRKDGKCAVLPFKPSDWRYLPNLDIAVAPIADYSALDVLCISTNTILSPRKVDRSDINVGDDVFMMGLFIDHEGGPKNVPAARFGNISMMPNLEAPLPQGKLAPVEAFVLDLHSRTGYSGSPVFVYRTFGSDLNVPIEKHFRLELEGGGLDVGRSLRDPRYRNPEINIRVEHEAIFELLGLHYAQFPEEIEASDGTPITGLSGMTCAIPAWRILDVLSLPEFVEQRERMAKELDQTNKGKPRPERASTPKAKKKPAPNPEHRADFNRLLGAAVKRPKSSG